LAFSAKADQQQANNPEAFHAVPATARLASMWHRLSVKA